jgi:hypothetical protein
MNWQRGIQIIGKQTDRQGVLRRDCGNYFAPAFTLSVPSEEHWARFKYKR